MIVAPVVDWTLGTPPVKSISLTTTAGDSDGFESAMFISFNYELTLYDYSTVTIIYNITSLYHTL